MDNNEKMAELQILLRRVDELKKQLLDDGDLEPETTELPPVKKVFKLPVIITGYMKKLGIPPHIKGYNYLRSAIQAVYENESLKDGITRELYPMIAKMYGTTSSRVERAIRHAIETGCDRGDLNEYEKVFGFTINSRCGKPTNSEFIATIVDDIRISNS